MSHGQQTNMFKCNNWGQNIFKKWQISIIICLLTTYLVFCPTQLKFVIAICVFLRDTWLWIKYHFDLKSPWLWVIYQIFPDKKTLISVKKFSPIKNRRISPWFNMNHNKLFLIRRIIRNSFRYFLCIDQKTFKNKHKCSEVLFA